MIDRKLGLASERWLRERFWRSVYGLFFPVAITGGMVGYYLLQDDIFHERFLVIMGVALLIDLVLVFHCVDTAWERWKRWDQFRAYMRNDIPSLEAQRFAREAIEEHRQEMLPSEDS